MPGIFTTECLLYCEKMLKKDELGLLKNLEVTLNGVFFNYAPSKSVHLDVCPSGLGAIFDGQV